MKILLIHSKTHGTHEVYFDDGDESLILSYKWHLQKKKTENIFYAQSHFKEEGRWKSTSLHRLILGIKDPKTLIDHKDRNGLNNCRENLRICSGKGNQGNKKTTNKYSIYKGVTFCKDSKSQRPWKAGITKNHKSVHLGNFSTAKEAALAYNKAAAEYFGEFALLNNISEE